MIERDTARGEAAGLAASVADLQAAQAPLVSAAEAMTLALATALTRYLMQIRKQLVSRQLAQRLGLRVSEASGISIKNVLRGGLAEEAGFAAGDEWLGVDDWRLGKLDDLALYAGRASHVSALVARDHRLLRLKLAMPGPSPSRNPVGDTASLAQGSWRLVVQDAAQVGAWLAR